MLTKYQTSRQKLLKKPMDMHVAVNVNLHFIWTLQVVKMWQGKRYNGISHRRQEDQQGPLGY